MYQNKVILMLFVAGWLCAMTVSGVVAPKGPLQSHITGGYKNIKTKSNISDLDCSQFTSDYDVLYHFSFPIIIKPVNVDWTKNNAWMRENENGTFVSRLYIYNESVVPLSLFCLKNLWYLDIVDTPFPNGIVPDYLENLKQLNILRIENSPIVRMTERVATLKQLYTLNLRNCSLTHLPDLSEISILISVDLANNRLSQLYGLVNMYDLDLSNNIFTEIPTLTAPGYLEYLNMDNNPVKNMLPIIPHVNLERVSLRNTSLLSVPATIDRLQKLQYLDLSSNKLFHLPTNILKLANLETLNIQDNSFSSADIKAFKTGFNKSRPNMTLIS
jgi:Leucine-rich repeat (LRR) protein